MGIEGIEISKLSGKLEQLATAADDGNGVIENNHQIRVLILMQIMTTLVP